MRLGADHCRLREGCGRWDACRSGPYGDRCTRCSPGSGSWWPSASSGITLGGNYNDNFQLPDTESTTAQNLLEDLSGSAGTGAGLDGQVVWKADSGKATEGAAGAKTKALLTKISTMPGVACVQTPFGDPLGSECPAPPADQGDDQGNDQNAQQSDQSPAAQGAQAHFGQSGVSPDGSVAYATVTFKGKEFGDLDTDSGHERAEPRQGAGRRERPPGRRQRTSSARSAARRRPRRASASPSRW